MPRLAAAPITLTASEQAELETLARRPSPAQQIALRAHIILRASRGAHSSIVWLSKYLGFLGQRAISATEFSLSLACQARCLGEESDRRRLLVGLSETKPLCHNRSN